MRSSAQVVLALALLSCSSKPTHITPDATTPEALGPRGDPTPPAWALGWLDAWLPKNLSRALFDRADATIPADLSDQHVLCEVDVQPSGDPLDGKADVRTHWRLPSGSVTRHGGTDPGIVLFRAGEIPSGATVAVRVVDEDDFGKDDQLGTLEGTFTPGQPFRLANDVMKIACRSLSAAALREGLSPQLRSEWKRRIQDIEPKPDPRDQPEKVRNDMIDSMRMVLTGVGHLMGWDDPEVWPLVKALNDLGPPTEGGRPLP